MVELSKHARGPIRNYGATTLDKAVLSDEPLFRYTKSQVLGTSARHGEETDNVLCHPTVLRSHNLYYVKYAIGNGRRSVIPRCRSCPLPVNLGVENAAASTPVQAFTAY